MQLSKLEIKGFKSFGEKVIIQFDKGVTGIVGPNGCGKSNVVDAIRWVLGEQKTKSLRSDKMENIIFNGTKTRPAAQSAQVSLTFDNDRKLLPAEYSQVTISRKYHRSGDSEYFINEVRCRLKDIFNLFLDTGIGSDSYAIIELKKVDEILSDKDNSRRELFEKAAGISKYKTRKKESLIRLEAVDNDLSRVGDLLFEIEKNLKSLEKQAKQAEKYFELKEEYKKVSLNFARKSITRQGELFHQLQSQIQNESQKRAALHLQINEKENFLEQEKEQLNVLETLLSESQKALNEHKILLKNTESEKKIRHEKIHYLTEKNTAVRQQISRAIQQQIALKEENEKLKTDKTTAEVKLNELENEVMILKEDLEDQKNHFAEYQRKIKINEEIYQRKQAMIFSLNKDFEIKQSQVLSLQEEIESNVSKSLLQNEELTLFETELDALLQNLSSTKKELLEFQEKEERKQSEVQELEQEIAAQKTAMEHLNRTCDAKENEYALSKSLLENMEGYPEAIKFLHSNPAWSEKVPLLSDLIHCEEKYRVAIENYLEPWLNYYVLNSEAEALKVIRLLDEAQKGKANFFILDKLFDSEMLALSLENMPAKKTKLSPETGFFFGVPNPEELKPEDSTEHVPALEVLDYEDTYQILIQYLLQDVLIVEDENYIMEAHDKNKNFVSRKGHIIQRKFSISGGSVGAYEGKKIGRAKNMEIIASAIETLKKQIHQQKEEIGFRQANLHSLKQNNAYKEAIRQTQNKLNQINEKYVAIRSKQEQLSEIILSSQPRLEEIKQKIKVLQSEIDTMQPQVQNEQNELGSLAEQIRNLNEHLAFENEHLSLKSNKYNQQNLIFHQQKSNLQNIEQQIQYKEQNLITLKSDLEKYEAELVQVENELEQLLEKQENEDEILSALNLQTPELEKTQAESEKNYYSQRATIADHEKELKELVRQKELLDSLLHELQNKIHETELSLTGIKERLSVEFQISLDDLIKETIAENTEINENELKEQVENLRQKIERLGTINPMAMETYKEMKERHDFIEAQKNDLVQSKASLMQTIHETEAYARNAFMKAYQQIRENFIKVFRSLFSGEDNADLLLSEPDNPLESKIDIIAQPKGKRPLSIDQLSGGEKTLTATSLLFALYLLKPAPFCIFDEVDAPLDDANTDKFNNIIKEFSADSQFIIVTHNKRTMATTDIMYGITMIEDGVSSVVPVDLRTLEEVGL